jgi:triacylglycerol lipase
MQFTNSTAAAYGLLVMHAMDMYRADLTNLTPPAAAGLTAAGWNIVAYITGRDTPLIDENGAPVKGPLKMLETTVCYGYLAQRAPGEMVAVIRGTDGFVEWIEDGEFFAIPYAPALALEGVASTPTVELGFWSLYDRMQLITPGKASLGALAPAIANAVGKDGSLTVVGHSLGSALATYLTLDLARGSLKGRVSACLFASPHTGNQAFVQLFDQVIGDYRLFNYILDVVPRVPLGLGYYPLPRRTVIQPATAEASIRAELGCNHHVICYCAMLDYEGTLPVIQAPPTDEASSAVCVLGPETGKPSLAKQLVAELAGLVPV